jgi:hypothetical protein
MIVRQSIQKLQSSGLDPGASSWIFSGYRGLAASVQDQVLQTHGDHLGIFDGRIHLRGGHRFERQHCGAYWNRELLLRAWSGFISAFIVPVLGWKEELILAWQVN